MEQISAVILAGGTGSRIGGAKALQRLQDKPLLDWVLEAIRPQCDEILISANDDPSPYARTGCRVIADRITGYAGPLAGLQSAMHRASHRLIASVPCDTPFLPSNLIERLHVALESSGADAVVAEVAGRRQSAIALYRSRVQSELDAYLDEGERKVFAWQDGLQISAVVFDDTAAFLNINTVEELSKANHILQTGGSGGNTKRTIA